MFRFYINRLALLTIINNLIFIVYFKEFINTTPYSSTWLIMTIEIIWLLSLTFLIIFPIILCSLLQYQKIFTHKLPLLAISLSFLSILHFSLTKL